MLCRKYLEAEQQARGATPDKTVRGSLCWEVRSEPWARPEGNGSREEPEPPPDGAKSSGHPGAPEPAAGVGEEARPCWAAPVTPDVMPAKGKPQVFSYFALFPLDLPFVPFPALLLTFY